MMRVSKTILAKLWWLLQHRVITVIVTKVVVLCIQS